MNKLHHFKKICRLSFISGMAAFMFNACSDESFWKIEPETNFTITWQTPDGQASPPPCTVTLTNTTNTRGLITTYDWTINGVHIATSKDATYTFDASESYTIKLTATNRNTSQSKENIVAIPEMKVSGITISPSENVSIEAGKTITLTATVTPADAANKTITWSSLNADIATVNAQSGVVTGVSAGTATIRASAADGSGVTANKNVTVTPEIIKVAGITISPSSAVTVEAGKTTTLTATVSPSNASNRGVTWSSLNTGIATVNAQSGVITGVSAGTATIRATAADGSGVTASKSVTVATLTVSLTSYNFFASGGTSSTINVTSNQSWTVSSNASWLTTSRTSGSNTNTFTMTATANTSVSTSRNATVTVAGGGISRTISVTQESIFTQGNGTQSNPYIIMTPAQLDAVRDYRSAHYKLGQNISLTSYLASGGAGYAKWGTAGWMPIGTFSGSLDGANYLISGLWINRTTNYVGLFDHIYDGTINNLGVQISNTNGGIKGSNYVGGVAALVSNNSTITNCNVSGNITGSGLYIGGVVGLVASGSLANCYTNCAITCTATGNFINGSGGIAGCINGGSISRCYATGTVSGHDSAGGIIGIVLGGGSIANCYATGAVNGSGNHVGGIAGRVDDGSLNNCFASGTVSGGIDAVGGVVGAVNNTNCIISNCVALNPSIKRNGNLYIGRIVGIIREGTLRNNWARSNMTITVNGPSKIFDKGSNKIDGADCAAIPVASWWTTASPNGPGWSSSIWTFTSGQLPKLR